MKVLKRLAKIIGFVTAVLVVLLALLALFTQTQFFKDRLRLMLVSTLSTNLNGTVQLGTIGGNFLNGFTIDSIAVYSGEEPFVTAGKLTCRYDPLTLLQKKLSMHYLIIEQPTIHFVRTAAGTWNLSTLMKAPEDTSRSAFAWALNFDHIELKNGTITVADLASLSAPNHRTMPASYVEYHNFSINDLNLQMSASIHPNDYRVRVVHANFYSPQSQFELSHFKGEFTLTDKGFSAKNTIIQTSHSYLELDAGIHGVNIFDRFDLRGLEHDSTQIQLRAKNIDFGELRSFISQVDFLSGSAFVDLEAGGEFGNLAIKHLNVQTYTSTFNISGNIRNLHTPDRLFLDVLVGDSKFDPSDANKLMPRFDLPRFDSLGQLSFFSEFVGNPWNFKSQTTLKGRCGGIVMNGNLTLDRPLPTYDATFTTNSLNLGMVLGNKKLQTFLNAKGKVSGRGFSIDNMTANLKMTADSSRFQKADISTAEVSINALPHRLEGAVVLTAREMRATLRAHADFTDAKLPRFGGDVGLISFDLANILNNKEYASNLTLRAKLSGSGHNIDDMSGDVTLELLPSTFQDRDLSEETVHIILDQQTPDDKHLSLQSSLADLDITGKFDLDLTTATLVHQAENLVETIKRHASPDSEVSEKKSSKFIVRPHTEAERQMNFDYIMNIKNLEPIASLLGGSPFDARANLKGTMKGTVDRLSLSCAGTFDEFYVGTVKGGILLNTGTIDLQANSLSDINTLEQLTGTLDCSFSSGLLNTTSLTGLQVNVKYNNLAGDFGASGIIDSTYAIQLLGKTSVQTHTYVFDLDTLRVSLGNYAWQNEQDVQFRLNLDGVRVMHAVMKRNDETFSTAGILHPSGDFDFDASLRKFDLSGINIWSRAADLAEPGRGFAGHADADVHLGGSMSVPVIRFNAFSEDTYFLQTHIGQVIASIDYSSQSAVIDVNVKTSSSDSVNSLVIKGTLPINLAFTDVEERFPDQEQHLQVLSEGFDLNVLDPLLPDFENLTGRLRSNLTLNGTPRNPRYAGTISLRDVRFIFGPNNIGYIVSGDLEPSGDQIMLKSFTVTNVPEKGLNGEAHFTGSIAIKNFEIASFDLTAFGQLLLMTAATRKTVPTMYGTLFAEIGGDGLRVTGSLDHPFLSGKLLIREANLVFPPTTKTGTMNSNLKLNYIVVDDSSRKSPLEQKHSKFYLVGDSANEAVLLNTPRYESPILERLRYNLSIETQGTTAMRMVFTPATNEELYAELEGKVTAVNNQGTPTIYGEISVSPRSYYNFFKKFDATGKLNFTGQWDNPELDINATYEGYRQVDEATLTSQPNADEKPLTEQKVIVELKITGKRYEPKLDMSMKVQRRRGEDPEDWSRQAKGGDVQSDAISFILTGKFREDLTSSERQNIASNFGSAGVSGFTSNLLSGILTDFLRQEFPFIRSAEFTYGGTGGLQENADLRLSGEAFKGYFRFGGKILNNLGNANVTYQLNVGDVFNSRSIRNLFLEFERRVEGSEATNEDKTTNATNSARLYYRFSF